MVYLFVVFFIIPLYVFGLSFAHPVILYIGVIIPVAVIFITVIINVLQNCKPEWLPSKLQNWDFLPIWLRSLKPYDK